MIAIIDYGVGNLRSVEKALQSVGADVVVISDADVLGSADNWYCPESRSVWGRNARVTSARIRRAGKGCC